MRIFRTYPRIIAETECGRVLSLKMRLNMEDGVLEVLAPNGSVWASAMNIEGLGQKLHMMHFDDAELGATDGNDSTGS